MELTEYIKSIVTAIKNEQQFKCNRRDKEIYFDLAYQMYRNLDLFESTCRVNGMEVKKYNPDNFKLRIRGLGAYYLIDNKRIILIERKTPSFSYGDISELFLYFL